MNTQNIQVEDPFLLLDFENFEILSLFWRNFRINPLEDGDR